MSEPFFEPEFAQALAKLSREALAPGRHGDMPRWREALDGLPEAASGWRIEDGVLVAGAPVEEETGTRLTETLRALIPWRKGPLRLGGVEINTEWRSDWKWDRVATHIDLTGARVLDIGAGNGYFGWRMLADGASTVIGCDPTLLFWHQFKAIAHFAGPDEHILLPLKFEQIPARADYDAVFSMGVLYHRRDPLEHLKRIRDHLRPGGQLALETLIVPGDGDHELDPPNRYANMRNVHRLPTATRLQRWLAETGFDQIQLIDATYTTPDEQRSTDWMPFHSLANALSPDLARTVEDHSPPLRAVVVALAPRR